MHKRVRVRTNDPKQSRVVLSISGEVKGYVNISPRYVSLTGYLGDAITRKIKLLPQKERPFTIKEIKTKEGKHIQYELKPLGEKPAQDGYQLVVTNTKTDAGHYRDMIIIATNLKEKPTINIPVSGRILARSTGAKPKKGP